MIKIFNVLLIITLLLFQNLFSQAPDTLWTKTFGGNLYDLGTSVKQTSHGGFIIAGVTKSFGAGDEDIYLIETDQDGDTLWTKTFGGSNNDKAYTIHQTNDNGFIIIGTTSSFGNGQDDFLLWKTDSLGNTQWFKTYGSSANERGYDGQQTLDGGYIIVGDSSGQSVNTWIIKTDNKGDILWSKSVGFNNSSYPDYHGYSVQQTNDSGYVICGTRINYEYPSSYRYNYFLAKFTVNGIPSFLKTYENNGFDIGSEVRKTNDGSLILAGTTGSPSYSWCWLIKANSTGNIIWQKTVVGSQISVQVTSFEVTIDGGFVFTVVSTSGSSAIPDVQLLKTDDTGILSWEKIVGGSQEDRAYSVCQTSDGGYIVAGRTNSFGNGDYDVWLLRFDNEPTAQVTVNSPNGGEHWLMGEQKDIIWTSNNVDSVKIELSLHNGLLWHTVAESTPSDGIYEWLVQAPQTSWDCRIKISDVTDSTVYDESDTTFVIDIFPNVDDSIDNFIPNDYKLFSNYPNPFNPVTTIKYQIPELSFVTLKVYGVLGNEISTLVNEEKPAGSYKVEFQSAVGGRQLASGIYYFQLRAGGFVETKKMILLR